MPKNLIETAKMKAAMDEAYNFISTHCINSIRIEMMNTGTINKGTTDKNVADTRMNLKEVHLSYVRKQSSFIAALPHNAKWTHYYNERNRDAKQKFDQILQKYDHGSCQRMDAAIVLVTPFSMASLFCSCQDTTPREPQVNLAGWSLPSLIF